MTEAHSAEIAWAGLGSNLNPERNLPQALALLQDRFGDMRISPAYRSAAVGGAAPDFVNLVVAFQTNLDPESVNEEFKRIEHALGRERGTGTEAGHTIDIDLLLLGNRVGTFGAVTLPRRDVTKYAYVLRPLAELEPEGVHPVLGKSFSELWGEWDQAGELVAVVLELVGSE
ncbi:MAG: 2-amino-4-hydroxy-6-hydroxymethyldihydropteridine diphosphokinase [Xanthomonadales bacterium]|nr:2-amino-4-hydroxy-6-hydroxymethyldihydropteridine diphosphokinase [Xanthomonadales bacterium]